MVLAIYTVRVPVSVTQVANWLVIDFGDLTIFICGGVARYRIVNMLQSYIRSYMYINIMQLINIVMRLVT